MATTYKQYAGDGSNRNFAVPFPYIDKTYVKVFLNGVETSAFVWTNDALVTLTSAPAVGVLVEIRRVTPTEELPVDFADGSVLSEDELDTVAKFSAHVSEEARDFAADAPRPTPLLDGFDIRGRRLTNVGAGVSPSDGVNKAQLDALLPVATGAAASATESKNAAADSATAAKASEDNAFAYLRAYRSTSYGALADDPLLDPNGEPPTLGDEYFNTRDNLLKRFNGATWQASDISTANLAAPGGASLVGFVAVPGGVPRTVESALRDEITVRAFGATGNGVTDDTAAIQAAINYCIANKRELVFDIGDYVISATLLATLPDKGTLTLRGRGTAAARYREPGSAGARIIASPTAGWTDGQPMLTTNRPATWYRTTVAMHNICFVGDNPDTDGVDTGLVIGFYPLVNTFTEECGFYRCKWGARYDGGFSKFIESYFGKCSWGGLWMEKGDAQVTDCQFDNMRRDADDGRTSPRGAGIYIWKGSNINITGGKIEACQKGIHVYRAQGLNIHGINFDFCRWTVNGISEINGEEAYATRSVNVIACRFLASIVKHVMWENNTTYQTTITLTGCSFARGNSDAYDNNTEGLLASGTYPPNNFLDFRGSGSFDVTVVGCNTVMGATTPSIFFPASGTLTLLGNSDTFLTVDLSGGDGKVVRTSRRFVMIAKPTTGTWKQGDVVEIQFPGAGSAQSYTCVLAGTFGSGTDPIFQPTGILGAVKAEHPLTIDYPGIVNALVAAGLMKP